MADRPGPLGGHRDLCAKAARLFELYAARSLTSCSPGERYPPRQGASSARLNPARALGRIASLASHVVGTLDNLAVVDTARSAGPESG